MVNAIRIIATTRLSALVGCRLSSSRQAAKSWAIAPPPMLRATALITNGSQTDWAAAIAIQPSAPTSAQIRNQSSRSGVLSDRRPIRNPASGAARFVT